MDKQLKKFLQNDVSIKHKLTTRNSAGEWNFADAVISKGRVEHRMTILRVKVGQELTSKTRIFFDSPVVVAMEDLVTLPTGEEVAVVGVDLKYDSKGKVDHKVVYV